MLSEPRFVGFEDYRDTSAVGLQSAAEPVSTVGLLECNLSVQRGSALQLGDPGHPLICVIPVQTIRVALAAEGR